MHIAVHAKISWIDDLVGARVYIFGERSPKHPGGGNLTVQYRLSVNSRLVSESLYANVSHVLRWTHRHILTQKPVIGLLNGRLT